MRSEVNAIWLQQKPNVLSWSCMGQHLITNVEARWFYIVLHSDRVIFQSVGSPVSGRAAIATNFVPRARLCWVSTYKEKSPGNRLGRTEGCHDDKYKRNVVTETGNRLQKLVTKKHPEKLWSNLSQLFSFIFLSRKFLCISYLHSPYCIVSRSGSSIRLRSRPEKYLWKA